MTAEDFTMNPERVAAAKALGLIATCPECGGTGKPTVATGPAGSISFDCDCNGFGFYALPAATEVFRQAVDVVNHLDEKIPLTSPGFPHGWAHHGLLFLIEHSAMESTDA